MAALDLSSSSVYSTYLASLTRNFFYKYNWLSKHAAEDLAQEVLVQAYRVGHARPTKALLKVIAERRGIDLSRKRDRRIRLAEQAAATGHLAHVLSEDTRDGDDDAPRIKTGFGVISYYSLRAADGPEEIFAAKEALEKTPLVPLSPALEELLSLMQDEGLTEPHEIALRLGISEENARKRLSRLRAVLVRAKRSSESLA